MRRAILLLASIGVLTAGALASCGGDDDTTSAPADGGGPGPDGTSSSSSSSSGGPASDARADAGAGDAQVLGVAAGSGFTCALRPNGHVYCWGANQAGQLGTGDAGGDVPAALEVAQLDDAVRVVAAEYSACALRRDRTVACWGHVSYGATGQPALVGWVGASTVPGLGDVVELAAGGYHVCARKADKSVWCWGLNEQGQLGYPNTNDGTCASNWKCNATPTKVAGVSADGIAAGRYHTCARVGAKAVCWGDNDNGELGHPPDTSGDDAGTNPTPTEALAKDVAAVFAHHETTCMLSGAGSASCWGLDDEGQLGDEGATDKSASPVPVAGLPAPVASIAPGNQTTCAVQNGAAWCWGSTAFGSLGADAGSGVTKAPPTRVDGFGGKALLALSSGSTHHCAAVSDGTVWCWGSNSTGELGHANTSDPKCGGPPCSPTPVIVGGLP